MMRQLANGLMGNEGPGAGSRWLDAELNSIYCVLTMLYTFNMLSSKCDNVNRVKPGTSNFRFGWLISITLKQKGFFTLLVSLQHILQGYANHFIFKTGSKQ